MRSENRRMRAALVLCLIAAFAGLLIGLTNAITRPVIDKAARQEANADRYAVFPAAEDFRALELAEDVSVSECFEALSAGSLIGYTVKTAVQGYGGEIEVTVGLDTEQTITGVTVGGPNFAETAGLGARVREEAFTAQFTGMQPPLVLKENVDAVSGASISSGAVVSALNRMMDFIGDMEGDGTEPEEPFFGVLPGITDYAPLVHGESVEEAYMAAEGYVIAVTATGYHGPIRVFVGLTHDGVVTGAAIDEKDFHETPGLGARVAEKTFLAQYTGLTGVIGVYSAANGASSATAQGGAGSENAAASDPDAMIDAVSGATVSSAAVTRAVNAAIAFMLEQPA